MDRSLLQGPYFLKDGRSFRKAVAHVHRQINAFVDEALQPEEYSTEETTKTCRHVFLDECVESSRDPLELRDGALTQLVAGRDTTASLLSWVFFFLAPHPPVFERLRGEVIGQFGTEISKTKIDYSTLKSVQYLQWVINETLRSHSVVSITNRQCTEDAVLPVGGCSDASKPIVTMRRKKVFLYFYAAHRREDIWVWTLQTSDQKDRRISALGGIFSSLEEAREYVLDVGTPSHNISAGF